MFRRVKRRTAVSNDCIWLASRFLPDSPKAWRSAALPEWAPMTQVGGFFFIAHPLGGAIRAKAVADKQMKFRFVHEEAPYHSKMAFIGSQLKKTQRQIKQ